MKARATCSKSSGCDAASQALSLSCGNRAVEASAWAEISSAWADMVSGVTLFPLDVMVSRPDEMVEVGSRADATLIPLDVMKFPPDVTVSRVGVTVHIGARPAASGRNLMPRCFGFRVWGLGFRVQGQGYSLGFKVSGLGFWV